MLTDSAVPAGIYHVVADRPVRGELVLACLSATVALGHVLSGARRVGAGEVWLFGFNNVRSRDARYFGPVPLANVRGALAPVVTW